MTRADDLLAIHIANKRLKDAKRALRSALAKQKRRAARIEAAVAALEENTKLLETAQETLRLAQRENDQAYARAADNWLTLNAAREREARERKRKVP